MSVWPDPRKPLEWHSGKAFAALFGREKVSDFAHAVNLLHRFPGRSRRIKGDRFPIKKARRRALELIELFHRYERVIVLGAGPAAALELDGWFRWTTIFGARVVAIPHPSGCNRWYNDARNRSRIRRFVKSLAV